MLAGTAIASSRVAVQARSAARQPSTAAATLRPLGVPALRSSARAGTCRLRARQPLSVRDSQQDRQALPPCRASAALQPPPALQQPGGSLWQRLSRLLARWTGVAALAVALAFGWAGAAHAARSGGRMGGAAFGGSRYGGGGMGGGMGSGMGSTWGASSSTRAWSAPSGSRYSSSRAGAYRGAAGMGPLGGGFGGGALGGTYSSPGSSVRVNSFFLSPFGFGYGVGYPVFGGGGLLSLLFWGAFAVIMLQVVQGVMRNQAGGNDDYSYGDGRTYGYDEVVTVSKVQVGLLGSARELQRDLERIAARADTSSPSGLHYILQETVLSLMRNPDYCLYGFAKSKRERSAEDAETAFNQLSLQERGKFQQETLVNVGGRTARSSLKQKKPYADGDKELIVVTILVAADGSFKMPQVDSRSSLREALSLLGSVRADDLLAVEVLWTPEEEGDFFTQEDLAYDYPTLNTL